MGTNNSSKGKESSVLPPTNGIWWLLPLKLLLVQRFRVSRALRMGKQWLTFINLLSWWIVRREVSVCLIVSSPKFLVHTVMERKPYVSWMPILQVHCPHWLSHILYHYPPGCRLQLFSFPQRTHLYESISEWCGLTDNYGIENIYTAPLHQNSEKKKTNKHISPIRHSSFPNSTLLYRIPAGLPLSCLLLLHPDSWAPVMSLSLVTMSFNFILPIIQTVQLFSLKSFAFHSKNFFFLLWELRLWKPQKSGDSSNLILPIRSTWCHHHHHNQNHNMTWHLKSIQWPRSIPEQF